MSPESLSGVLHRHRKESVCNISRGEEMWNRDVRMLLSMTKFRATLLTDYLAFRRLNYKFRETTSVETTFGRLDRKPFWKWRRSLFFSFRSKTHQNHAYYLGIEWSAWTVLIKSEILITKGMVWPVSSKPVHRRCSIFLFVLFDNPLWAAGQ